jgi:hypothetical protein
MIVVPSSLIALERLEDELHHHRRETEARLVEQEQTRRAMSPRPIAHICCSPPESVPASWRSRSRSRGNSANTRSSAVGRAARVGAAAPSSRLSRTVIVGKSWRPSGTWAMPRATICAERDRRAARLELDASGA